MAPRKRKVRIAIVSIKMMLWGRIENHDIALVEKGTIVGFLRRRFGEKLMVLLRAYGVSLWPKAKELVSL